MLHLWTKNGHPLAFEGNDVLTLSGTPVGRVRGDRVFRTHDGTYVGTLVGDRLVFRSYDAEGPNRPYTRRASSGPAIPADPLPTWGDEPTLPD